MWKLSLRVSGEHGRAWPQPGDEPRWRQQQPGQAQPSFRSRAFSLTMRSELCAAKKASSLTACVTLYSKSFQKNNCFIYITKHSLLGEFLFSYLSAFIFFSFLFFFFFVVNLALGSWCTVEWDRNNFVKLFMIFPVLYVCTQKYHDEQRSQRKGNTDS